METARKRAKDDPKGMGNPLNRTKIEMRKRHRQSLLETAVLIPKSPARLSRFHWLLVVIVACIGCGTDAQFAGTKAIDPDEGWEASDKAAFDWQIADSLERYDFYIDLRHDQQYPFSNVYLFVDFTFPDGRTLKDTVSCQLADERGKWLGSGFGNMVDHRIGFRRAQAFPLPGDYAISISHGMRVNPLPGISDVGFRLEAASKK